ncbi:MAG: class I SAM-dependent methyltransferase [Rubripirellula sp.]
MEGSLDSVQEIELEAMVAIYDTKQKIQDDDYSFPYHYIPQFSPGYSQTYSWPWGLYYVSAMEYVLEKLRVLCPSAVADVGTGDGRLVRELTRTLPDAKIVGIDYSDRAIQLAKALNPNLDFRCMDVIRDTVGETFEVVTLIEVFEHIPPELTESFAAAIHPLMMDQGHLFVTVPHENMPVSRKHFQHFSADSLRSYFEPHFVLEETVFLDKRNWAVRWILKLLENQYFILAHWGIRNRVYRLYKRFFLISDEPHCGRIFMHFRPRPIESLHSENI